MSKLIARRGSIFYKHITKNFSTSKGCLTKLKWSYTHGASTQKLLGITIGEQLAETVNKHPEKTAAIFCQQNVQFSFQELLEQSDRLAAGLTALGVKPGERVGIWAPNCPEWIIAQYGTARGGFILVNINPAYQTSELGFALKKVGVKAIIAAESFKTQDYYHMLCGVCPELPTSTPNDIKSQSLPDLKTVVMLSDKDFPGAIKYSDLMDAGSEQDLSYIQDLQHKLQFDDPINIQFTSGTTGNPKGATLTHHNILNNSAATGMTLEYHMRETRLCNPVPLYHCFGMVVGSLSTAVYGSTLVYPASSFDAFASLKSVHDHRCTSMYGTPTMFIDMLNHPDLKKFDLTSLNTGVMAGSPCPIEVMKKVVEDLHMPDVTICYGTTENSPVTFQTLMTAPLEKRVSTIGQVIHHTEAKIVDTDGSIVPVNSEGELCIRGYCVMLNYWNDPEKTKEVLNEDRWYKTGDIATMDEDGYARIVGRIKDMIIRGGENIYPVEVENFLYKHPKIEDVQIIGIPDVRFGEQVAAWIKLREGQTATEEEIKDFCKGQISHFKIPHYIMFVSEFPLTVTGKVQKFKMREATKQKLGFKPTSLHHEI